MEIRKETVLHLTPAEIDALICRALGLDPAKTKVLFSFRQEGPQFDSYTVICGMEVRSTGSPTLPPTLPPPKRSAFDPCDCDLRDRRWNPNTQRCETCGRPYVDLR